MRFRSVAAVLFFGLLQSSLCPGSQAVPDSGNGTDYIFCSPATETIKPDSIDDYSGSFFDDFFDNKFDQHPGSGGFGQSYWLVHVLRFLIILESGSLRLASTPVVIPLVIALRSLTGAWLTEEAVLNQIHSINETPVGDPSFLFSEPIDSNGKRKATDPGSSNDQQPDEETPEGDKPTRKKYKNGDSEDDGDGLSPDPNQNSITIKLEIIPLAKQLNTAIHNQDVELVKNLLDQGADPDEAWEKEQPLFVSIYWRNRNFEIFKLLLDRGARTDIEGLKVPFYGSPLYNLLFNTPDIAENVDATVPFIELLLLEHKADCLHMEGRQPVLLEFFDPRWDRHQHLREMALTQISERGIDINNIPCGRKLTLLHYMCKKLPCYAYTMRCRYSVCAFELLIKFGANHDLVLESAVEMPGRRLPEIHTPIGEIFKSASFNDHQRISIPAIKLFLSLGVNCLRSGYDFKSILLIVLESKWERFREIRPLVFQQLNIDINFVTIAYEGILLPSLSAYPDAYERFDLEATRRYIENAGDLDRLDTIGKHWLVYILKNYHKYSEAAVYFLISVGLLPNIPDEEMNNCNDYHDHQIPILTAIKNLKNLYEANPLQFSCLVQIANSLTRVDDIELLVLPEKFKAKLRSEPIVCLIGIHSSTQAIP